MNNSKDQEAGPLLNDTNISSNQEHVKPIFKEPKKIYIKEKQKLHLNRPKFLNKKSKKPFRKIKRKRTINRAPRTAYMRTAS